MLIFSVLYVDLSSSLVLRYLFFFYCLHRSDISTSLFFARGEEEEEKVERERERERKRERERERHIERERDGQRERERERAVSYTHL